MMRSFAAIIAELDATRRAHFRAIGSTPTGQHPATPRGMTFAPIASNVVFLVPHGEPFFSNLVPRLVAMGATKQRPMIHIGVGGTRNLSIIGLTKADAGLFVDLNVNQLSLMTALADVAKRMEGTRGPGSYGPRDFVREFAKHPRAQAILDNLPFEETECEIVTVKGRPVPPTRRTDRGFHTDLAEELIVPESWLYEHQDPSNGPFRHVMALFANERIGTLALNLVDREGFQELSEALRRATDGTVQGLEEARVGTIFLANLLSHIAAARGYFKFGNLDRTPRGGLPSAWSNIERIAPNDSYVIFAEQSVRSLRADPANPLMDRRLLDGPTMRQLHLVDQLDVGEVNDTLRIAAFQSTSTSHHCDWHPGNQATMGGRLGVVKALLNELHQSQTLNSQSDKTEPATQPLR